MAKVERYVRLSVAGLMSEDDETIIGLAFEPHELVWVLRSVLHELLDEAASAVLSDSNEKAFGDAFDRDQRMAEAVHVLVDERWPGRAHFIEVQHNDTMEDEDGWVQIFQPYGLPQD